MRLKLSDLQQVVKKTLQEKNNNEAFCDEIKKVFGPSVIVKDTLESLVETANDHLDVLEYKGKLNTINFSKKIAQGMMQHESSQVRKFVARVLPVELTTLFLLDKNESVRLVAAKRAPLHLVEKAIKRFPNDIMLNEVLESRTLEDLDSAIESSKIDDDSDVLSEEWYEKTAKKLIQDYGRTLDTTWKDSAVKTFCSSQRSTLRLPVDSTKLMEKINVLLQDYEKVRAKELGLVIKEGLEFDESDEDDSIDPVTEMMNEGLTPQQFIQEFSNIFNVKFANLPTSIMKYRIREGLTNNKIPVSCTLPHNSSTRRLDEIVLDSFVKHWNNKQAMSGEPFKINWAPHPDSLNKITFRVELK